MCTSWVPAIVDRVDPGTARARGEALPTRARWSWAIAVLALTAVATAVAAARFGLSNAPASPPALPAGADRVAPLTLEATVRRQAPDGTVQTLHQTISRTSDRIHVATSEGREWLFERSVRDRRRVSGFLIDHPAQAIVVYDESGLRAALGIRGWASVLMLGCDADLVAQLEPVGQTRSIGGIRFDRYTTGRKDVVARDVWWSDSQIFPGDIMTADGAGSTRFSIEQLRAGVDAALLQSPVVRFPAYRLARPADWPADHSMVVSR